MKIALISCTSSKKDYPCKASEMYLPSPRFALAYAYAKQVADVVYIISAKYGLLPEDQVIESYNETLIGKSVTERKAWSEHVLEALRMMHSLDTDSFVILAGNVYNAFLLPSIRNYELPLKGLSMGRWIPKFREMIDSNSGNNLGKSKSVLLHQLFNQLPRYRWTDIVDVPFESGIYIMYETGESFHNMDRIVRIGTHNADGRLKERLRDHFLRRNKDGSILRKNIGLALLHKDGDPFETIWGMDGSKPEVRSLVLSAGHLQTLNDVEKRVTDYLHENISFTCIRVDTKLERLRVEDALITTLNRADDFACSDHWLGLYSPKYEIADSGLWNTNGLNGKELSFEDIEGLGRFVFGEGLKQIEEMETDEVNVGRLVNERMKTEKVITERTKSEKISAEEQSGKASTADIKVYIESLKEKAKLDSYAYIDIVSGDVHKSMHLKSKMPSVCIAMYKAMCESDEILHTTPSGKSSTIKVRYLLLE